MKERELVSPPCHAQTQTFRSETEKKNASVQTTEVLSKPHPMSMNEMASLRPPSAGVKASLPVAMESSPRHRIGLAENWKGIAPRSFYSSLPRSVSSSPYLLPPTSPPLSPATATRSCHLRERGLSERSTVDVDQEDRQPMAIRSPCEDLQLEDTQRDDANDDGPRNTPCLSEKQTPSQCLLTHTSSVTRSGSSSTADSGCIPETTRPTPRRNRRTDRNTEYRPSSRRSGGRPSERRHSERRCRSRARISRRTSRSHSSLGSSYSQCLTVENSRRPSDNTETLHDSATPSSASRVLEDMDREMNEALQAACFHKDRALEQVSTSRSRSVESNVICRAQEQRALKLARYFCRDSGIEDPLTEWYSADENAPPMK